MQNEKAAAAMAELNISDSALSGKKYEEAVRGPHLVIDSGGTKVAAILFDDDFHLIAKARSGSLRANSTPAALVQAHFNDMTEKLGLKPGDRIGTVSGTYEKAIDKLLSERFTVEKTKHLSELDLGLGAAGLFGVGLLAIAGTGATVCGRIDGNGFSAGGYGSAVADEGSGYWISREAMIAAIRDFEERGPSTRLTGLIASHFGGFPAEHLREAIFSIYSMDSSPVTQVAGIVPLVVEAAEAGDKLSVNILSTAGKLIAEQMLFLIRRNSVADNIPIAVSGSVWRRNPLFVNAFTDRIRQVYPEREFVFPQFQPIIGAVAHIMCANRGGRGFTPEEQALLLREYAEYKFET